MAAAAIIIDDETEPSAAVIENLPPPDTDDSKKNAEDALPSEKVEIQALEAKDGVFNLQEELERDITEDIDQEELK